MYTDSNFAQKKTAYFSSQVFRVSRQVDPPSALSLRPLRLCGELIFKPQRRRGRRDSAEKYYKTSKAVNFPDTATPTTDI